MQTAGKKSKRFALIAVAVAAFVLLSAYVEPFPLLFDHLSQKMAVWRGLIVTMNRLSVDPASGRKYREEVVLRLKRPGKIRMDLVEADGLKKARKAKPLQEASKRFTDLMLSGSDKEKLWKMLENWGVKPEPIVPGRKGKTICLIVGAREGQEDRAQLWIEKFSYMPARLLYYRKDKKSTKRFEILMDGWDLPAAKGLFPQKVTFRQDGRLVEKWDLIKVEKTGDLP